MSRSNNILLAVAVLLLATSIAGWRHDVQRAERFERGQKFLPNLNPDEVARVTIRQGEETTTLERKGEAFNVVEAKGYRAKNEVVNRFLRDLLDLTLDKEVGSGERLAAELSIEPPGDETIEVALANASGNDMVRFRIGKSADGGSGRFLARLEEGSPIYLSEKSPYFSTKPDDFLQKEIVDVAPDEVTRIAGGDFVFAKADGGALELGGIPAGKKLKTGEANQVKSVLSRLSFDKAYLADDPRVSGLDFQPALTVELGDQGGYQLDRAKAGEKTYLRIHTFRTIDRVEFSVDSTQEELVEKAAALERADQLQGFNAVHDPWVYELADYQAKKLELRMTDLIEG